ncbi:MAG: antitoxin [Verrucomicrobiota bacterium]
MRTTVTIDPDTERLLKDESKRTGKSFKRVLNEAVRMALGRESAPLKIEPIFNQPFPANLQDANFNQLAEEWDDEETLAELHS